MGHEKRRSDLEIDLLLEGLLQLHEADFRQHERHALASRISRFAAEHGMSSIAMLLPRVIHDDEFASSLCKTLLCGERKTLENPYELHALNSVVEATLSSYPAPKIWIAECTSAEEIFVLAILLSEARLLNRSHIFVTCSNEEILREVRHEMAQAGNLDACVKKLAECGIASSSGKFSAAWEEPDFLDELHLRISWFHYNLLLGSSFNEFQLISCRENFFNFGASARRRILSLFHDSLSSFGVMNIGEKIGQEDAPFLRSYRPLSDNGIFQRSA